MIHKGTAYLCDWVGERDFPGVQAQGWVFYRVRLFRA